MLDVKKELPVWALPTAIVVGIVALVFIGWKTFTGYNSVPGKWIDVKPGMYDLKKELSTPHGNRHKAT